MKDSEEILEELGEVPVGTNDPNITEGEEDVEIVLGTKDLPDEKPFQGEDQS